MDAPVFKRFTIILTENVLKKINLGASPGQEQMDIAYAGYTPKLITSHFMVEVIVPYLTRRMSELSGRIDISRMYSKIEAIYEVSFFCIFLFSRRVCSTSAAQIAIYLVLSKLSTVKIFVIHFPIYRLILNHILLYITTHRYSILPVMHDHV